MGAQVTSACPDPRPADFRGLTVPLGLISKLPTLRLRVGNQSSVVAFDELLSLPQKQGTQTSSRAQIINGIK